MNIVYSNAGRFQGESNDCTVRALVEATGMPYAEAHEIFRKAGRKNNRGTRINVWAPIYKDAGFKGTAYGKTGFRYCNYTSVDIERNPKGTTLAKFVATHPTGSHMVCIRGHMLAVVDGVIRDTGMSRPGSHVIVTFTKVEASQTTAAVSQAMQDKKVGFDRKAYMKAYNARKRAEKAALAV